MSIITEVELKKQISEGRFNNLYLIYGNEPYLKQFYTSKIISKAVDPQFSAFNLHIFDSPDTSLSEISDCAEAFPMMDDKTCVVVKDMNLSSLNQSQLETLEKIISDIPQSTVLIFQLQNVQVDIKKNDKWKKIISLFDKNGCAVPLDKKTVGEIKKLLISGAGRRGHTLSPNVAEYMINTVGDDLNQLLNELEKLCYYCKDESIEKKDVDEIVTKSTEASVFELAGEIVAGNRDMSFKKLSYLFFQKTEPVNINAALISAYVDMYRAKVYVTSGGNARDAAKYYNYRNKEFRLTSGLRDASRMNLEQLRKCLDILGETDLMLKSTNIDKKLLLEQTIVKLMLVSNGENV